MATSKIPITTEKNRSQTKTLSADVSADGAIADLAFTGLTIGKRYKITGQVDFFMVPSDGFVGISIQNGATTVGSPADGNGSTVNSVSSVGVSTEFEAVSTSITATAASLSSGSLIRGNGTKAETFLTLTELNNTIETDIY